MKKILILGLAAVILLAACATAQTPSITPAPTKVAYATPDTSLAIPLVGSATVLNVEGVKSVQLYSQPDAKSPVSGFVYPAEQGKLLGADSSGRWILVQIGDRIGWAPHHLFALTIAE